jgi:diguanylate cyclase (GGDEF)-like protein
MLRLLERRIRSAGYDVLTAHDGEEAIRCVLVERPAVVVTDWSMPNMDGLELCRVLRRMPQLAFVYIVIITAQTEEDRVVEAFEAGADDFLSKPLRQQGLLARLKAAMRIVQLEDDLARQNRSIRDANGELMKLNSRLDELARTDPLTGLANRREAMAILNACWTQPAQLKLSCLLIDIDHFKQLNDRYGHDFGDRVLCKTAVDFLQLASKSDRVCRVGGEEFLVVCPDRSVDEAAQLARDLCQKVRSSPVCSKGVEAAITISIGVAERDARTDTPDQLLKNADDALYAAKEAGRDRVCLAGAEFDGRCSAGYSSSRP